MSNEVESVETPEVYTPVKLGGKKKSKTPEIVLFEIDGKKYKIKDKRRPQLMLKLAKVARDQGQGAVELALLEEVLGSEAFDDLMSYDDLEDYELSAIIDKAIEVTLGDLEELKKAGEKKAPKDRAGKA